MTIKEYIIRAIITGKSITIKYQKYDGTISSRRISNITYSDEFGNDYIEAYCHLRKEKRTFKISRILQADTIRSSAYPSSVEPKRTTYTPTKHISSTSSYGSSYSTSTNAKRNEGCYIATMAYGDYDHPQVMILRNYRDQVLSKSTAGRLFIRLYYYFSPKLVSILKGHRTINNYIRWFLDEIINNIQKQNKAHNQP